MNERLSAARTHPLDADGTRMQVVREGGEGGEGERVAHKQGLQRVLASINQLRKEREEFAYPLLV